MSPSPEKRRASASPKGITGQPEAAPSHLGAPWHKWLFRAIAVLLVPVSVLGLLEGGLRLCGYGYPTSFLLHETIDGKKVLVENERFGWRFFGPQLARTPRPVLLPSEKAARTCRVFVFGESAAYGDPRPEFGMPRLLEVLLRERFPGVKFEVVNAAMTGINSHVILPIARDCAREEGDLWVIYAGNNEVVGPFGGGTIFGPQAPSLALVRSSLALKTTRTGQLLTSVASHRKARRDMPAEWEGMAMFLRNQVRHDDPRMAVVYAHFARNLEDIIRIGREHGAKVALSTMASNLKECPPFGSQHRRDLPEDQLRQWEKSYGAGVEAERAGQTAQALAFYEAAGRLDADFAELQFRWGRCCLAFGQVDEARRHLVLARDYDTLRFRADSRLNEIIRKTAAGGDKEGLMLVDAESTLGGESPQGLTGEELFHEHVHLTFEGNYVLARTLAEAAVKLLPAALTQSDRAARDWLSIGECARRLAWTDWEQYKTVQGVLLRLNEAPFTSQLGHQEKCGRCRKRLEVLLPSTRHGALRQAAEQCRQALELAPGDWVLHRRLSELLLKLGDISGAEQSCRQVIQLLPHDALGYVELGSLLVQAGRADEAIGQFDQALRLNPASVAAVNGRALALTRLGKQSEAVLEFEHALRLKPNAADTHINLGTALEAIGKKEEARTHFRQALREPLKTPEVLVRVGKVCLTQGWVEEAITNFTRAVNLSPTDAGTHYLLGAALDSKGRNGEAEQQFAEAVRLDPDLAGAHMGLGVELRRQGKESEAIGELSEAVRLDGNLVQARLYLGAALWQARKFGDARTQFEAVLRQDPNNATARKYMQAAQ